MIATSQEFGTHRRTDQANKKTIKASTLFREAINVRGTEILVAVEAQVSSALVVSQNYDDVWPVGLLFFNGDKRVEGGKKEKVPRQVAAARYRSS